ncbi:helix-turn-helix domain-containing protein [Streptomyces hainanensis]|uniref:XRE family transcriptional regulator n=1 Tax=Streptomyces hainanensis TaxID=402648 RepID=A0A4R4TTG8_9ACTN|nr:helix-turn-helix transcriptional regulator [Streptomyces hainanensis]TDC78792.1 XRE family transcriptional regulator [Streptomyces hainanensis]
MSDDFDVPTRTIGTRIHELRTIRGFSLSELGRRAHVSAPQLSRIERGQRFASPGVVASVARVLGVGVSVLRGQPYIHMLQKDRLDALLSPISSALDSWDLLPDDESSPRSLDTLESEARRIAGLRVQTKFVEIADDLPGLLVESALVTQASHRSDRDRERAFALQCEMARTAAIVAYRMGFIDMARLALARLAAAAPQSGDPRQVAVERFERACITHAESSRPDRGVALVRRALRDLDDDGDRITKAVRGTLQLRAATHALRSGDASASEDFLAQATELSQVTGETGSADAVADYALSFGPIEVALSQLAAANDREDHTTALKWAAEVRLPADYRPTGAARYWIDKARAETWTARHDAALVSLSEAKRAAPQLTRYHPSVHELVGTLLRARAKAPDPLREFAMWSGV